MSGHSKWSKIKHKKGVTDAKKGMIFTKLAKAITLAAGEGGGDPQMNFTLRLAIERAKAENMPNENIVRAIKKGTGEIEGDQIQRISYEALGPASSMYIIDCATDNTNRTIAEIKRILENHSGKIVGSGSVAWQFEEKGLIIIRPAKLKKAEKYGVSDTYEPVKKEDAMMELMEVDGILDIAESTQADEDGNMFIVLEVFTTKKDFALVDRSVRNLHFQIISSELIKIAKNEKVLTGEEKNRVERLIEQLEEHDDVESVWTNIK